MVHFVISPQYTKRWICVRTNLFHYCPVCAEQNWVHMSLKCLSISMASFKILTVAQMWPTRLLMFIYSFPTGITVDRHGFVYFVDGTMIRRIDENAVITTVIGSNGLTSTQPLSCDSGMDITQVRTTGFQMLPPFGIMEMDDNCLTQKWGRKETWFICYNTK